MSDMFGNHIVGFPTRRLIYVSVDANQMVTLLGKNHIAFHTLDARDAGHSDQENVSMQ